MPRVAINGFGRIGRSAFKILIKKFPNLEIAAINDLSDPGILAHLLRYDSIYGIYENRVKALDGTLFVDGVSKGRKIRVFSEKDPENLPWKDLGVDIALECTGYFRDYQGARKHIDAGAKKVIISAPSKDPEKIPSYIVGVNDDIFDPAKDDIVDMASCTTNALAPVAKVLNVHFGIEKGFMTTTHSYTTSQRILDSSHSDLRRARAAALNIIPTSTGATKALGRVLPELDGKIDGIALRIPTPIVSLLDFFCELKKDTTKEDVNYIMKKETQRGKLYGILGVEDAPLVSSDYIGSSFSAVVDSSFTMAKKNTVKIVAWYDNEWGYSTRLADFTNIVAEKLKSVKK